MYGSYTHCMGCIGVPESLMLTPHVAQLCGDALVDLQALALHWHSLHSTRKICCDNGTAHYKCRPSTKHIKHFVHIATVYVCTLLKRSAGCYWFGVVAH